MKIVVLGATGNVGSRFTAQAAAAGHQIIAYARNPEAVTAQPGVTTAKGSAEDTAEDTAAADPYHHPEGLEAAGVTTRWALARILTHVWMPATPGDNRWAAPQAVRCLAELTARTAGALQHATRCQRAPH